MGWWEQNANVLISIHAPRTGSDSFVATLSFQAWDFNPRSPHGERHARAIFLSCFSRISIHAPRTGSDHTGRGGITPKEEFQSTLPARGATRPADKRCNQLRFQSTLPARGATPPHIGQVLSNSFQSTLPARGATLQKIKTPLTKTFQSTLPARGATGQRRGNTSVLLISIHAPRTGSDMVVPSFCRGCPAFQSTLPARGATRKAMEVTLMKEISIHAPRTGSDAQRGQPSGQFDFISIHAPRTGSDKILPAPFWIAADFNPRSPHGERR